MNDLAAALLGMALVSAYVMRVALSMLIEADDVPERTLNIADRLAIPCREHPTKREVPAYPPLQEDETSATRPDGWVRIPNPPELTGTIMRRFDARPPSITPGEIWK